MHGIATLYYKLKKMLTLVCDMANSTIQHDWVFLKIAIMMVTTVVISQVLVAYSWYSDNEIRSYLYDVMLCGANIL